MKVADLQDILALIRQMLISAGSKGPAAELAEFSAALDPFRDMTAKALTTELNKITGKTAKPKAGKKTSLSPAEVNSLISDVKTLYASAGNGTLTVERVDATIHRLEGLKKPDIVRAAEGIGMGGMKSKKIPEIVSAIRQRIVARMGAGQRMGMIEVAVGNEDT